MGKNYHFLQVFYQSLNLQILNYQQYTQSTQERLKVSKSSAERRAGSIPALGTILGKPSSTNGFLNFFSFLFSCVIFQNG